MPSKATTAPTRTMAFSFIELVTVVALIGIITTSAAPVASSLFQRHREMVLRENLLTLRKAITQFDRNLYDDDSDNEIDEDPRGDANHDGYPGIRRVDDDGDLREDEDWLSRSPFTGGSFNPAYDWGVRRDDDEDGRVDEEAFPSDLNDLTMKVPLLRKTIPIDPTLRTASWDTVLMKDDVPNGEHLANNDFDWYEDVNGDDRHDSSAEPIVVSSDAVYSVSADKILTDPAGSLSGGDPLKPLTDEDPRNQLDDDGDGQLDEDAPDMLDVRSLNSARGLNQTSYSVW